ncbi:hypothetical protein GF322_02285 [Candidatus Dependentiae bacterium]|nr:hypothetical protein [Candidatus Dependentiae bacterium]
MKQNFLSKIIAWAKQEPQIRALILTGSRAEKRKTDELSDYDIAVICKDYKSYTKSNDWILKLKKFIICIPEKMSFFGKKYPTRLIIFEDHTKIDFSFFPLNFIKLLSSKKNLPDQFNRGYKVILDKDGITKKLPKPTYEGFKIKKPPKKEFLQCIDDFWFEVYHVAIYLARQDLWHAKFRDNDIKNRFLLKMIEWNEGAKHNWNYETNSLGKRMQSWVSKKTWKSCFDIFAHFDAQDSWQALLKMMNLFRTISKETAKKLGYKYPEHVDTKISSFVEGLKNKAMRS